MSMPTGAVKSLKGTGYNQFSNSNFRPEQENLFKLFSKGVAPGIESGLKSLSGLASGDESEFQAMEAPALRQFGQLKGNIASQFSGAGAGSRRSSFFKKTMNTAATDLTERLQNNRVSMKQQAINDLLGIGRDLIGQRTFETNLLEKKKNPMWDILASLAGMGSNAGAGLGTLGLAKKWGIT